MIQKIYLFIVSALFFTLIGNAQTLTGKVIDGQTKEPVSGASVTAQGAGKGTTTDEQGNFSLDGISGTGRIAISHIGYEPQTVSFDAAAGTDLGTIELTAVTDELESVVVIGKGVIDLAKDRATPIAASTIKGQDIQDKVGTGDVTQVLNNMPSVYVGNQSSGFGDTKILVRGYEQDNTAFLLNGQPINGMEDGKMYWSNWSGMSDIANAIQVQRGLGSSKLAISSVGGTVNFITKATEMHEGGFVSLGTANNSYYKGTIAYNTGINENGWGASIMLSHWQGNGYNAGTKGLGQNYFISVGYRPNEKHQFNILLTGAPQWHDQNFAKTITDYQKYGRKYNNNWGFLNGEYLNERKNYYHKPVFNFNWDYTINSTTNLSTVLYASWGRGGGTGPYGGFVPTTDAGQKDFDQAYAKNLTAPDGIGNSDDGNYLIRASANNHAWYGLVSNLNKKLSERWNLNLGVDLRTYKGTHFQQVVDFMGLKGWTESKPLLDANHEESTSMYTNTVTKEYKALPWFATFNTAPNEQRINYNYSENISYGGVFGQLEYSNDAFSAFFQGALSDQFHVRTDYYYLPELRKSEKVSNIGYNVKGGASYKFDPRNVFFVNAGYYSRQPYHDNIYLNFTNALNPLTSNEKILGLEAGYSFNSTYFTANLNGYRTSWKDRVVTSSNTDDDGNLLFTTNQGVEQVHTGVELDIAARPVRLLTITGFASVGNWEYKGEGVTTVRDEDLNTISETSTDFDGGKVGGAAQTTVGLGAKYEFVRGLSVDADWRYYDRLYATVGAVKENLELPNFNLLDAGIAYKFTFPSNSRQSLRLRFFVGNVFNYVYLSDLTSNIKATDNIDRNDPSKGTYESTGKLYKGIADANRGYFGIGRTWNVTLRYSF